MADMPPAAWAIVKRMFAEKRMDYLATEDGARAWTLATCSQLAFTFPGAGWCAKRAGNGRPLSKDVVARATQSTTGATVLEGWAVLTAAGANGPRTLTDPPEYVTLEGQIAVPVTATNHLAAAPPDDGGTTEDDDHRELIAACDRIATGLFDVATGLAGLSERIAAVQRDGIRVRMG